MDEYKQFILLVLFVAMLSFLFIRLNIYKNRKTTLKLSPLKLRFNQFTTQERHVINEAIIDMLREYNFKPNKSTMEIKKHESLQKLKEELKVFIR